MSLPLTPPRPFVAVPSEDGQSAQRVPEVNPRCVVCGHENPHGLQLTFTAAANGTAAEWVPGKNLESFQGIVHGGVISTVLDEAMSKAIIAIGIEAFTMDLRVRFRQKLHIGERVHVRGWVVRQQKRRIEAEASLCSEPGWEYAHAWGIFLMPPRRLN